MNTEMIMAFLKAFPAVAPIKIPSQTKAGNDMIGISMIHTL